MLEWLDYAQVSSLIYSHGLAGLFAVCFFSASLIPFPSEPIIMLATKFFDPLAILVVVTISSTLAAFINYWIGLKGLHPFFLKRDPVDEKKAERWFAKWGAPTLVASPWIPFIGDLFPVAAGTLEMSAPKFLFWIIVARVVKTLAVMWFGITLFKLLGI